VTDVIPGQEQGEVELPAADEQLLREGQVANRPIYLALGVTVDGERDVLGLWAGEHGDGEGAKFWLRILSEIKNRGVRDVCMLVCDGLKGLPDAVSTVWEKTIVQTCIVHLLRNSFKYASQRDWAQLAKDLKPIYTAASEAEALDRFAEFSGKVGETLPRDHPAVGERLGRIRALPGLRPGNTHRDLHHQRDRVDQRPAPAGRERPRPLPHRAGRPQMPLPGDHEPRPDREGPPAVDQPVEGPLERLRHHLRRPPQRRQEVTTKISYTVKLTDPSGYPLRRHHAQ
jgi:putative transposase